VIDSHLAVLLTILLCSALAYGDEKSEQQESDRGKEKAHEEVPQEVPLGTVVVTATRIPAGNRIPGVPAKT